MNYKGQFKTIHMDDLASSTDTQWDDISFGFGDGARSSPRNSAWLLGFHSQEPISYFIQRKVTQI